MPLSDLRGKSPEIHLPPYFLPRPSTGYFQSQEEEPRPRLRPILQKARKVPASPVFRLMYQTADQSACQKCLYNICHPFAPPSLIFQFCSCILIFVFQIAAFQYHPMGNPGNTLPFVVADRRKKRSGRNKQHPLPDS